jgi:hypothetical protein
LLKYFIVEIAIVNCIKQIKMQFMKLRATSESVSCLGSKSSSGLIGSLKNF